MTSQLARLYRDEAVIPIHVARDRSRLAEFVVALSASDSKKAVVSAAFARKALSAYAETVRSQVEALWNAANREAMEHVLLVMENNLGKTKAEIFARSDVQSALLEPYMEAVEKSSALLNKAFSQTEKLTTQHLKGEFKLLGESWQGYDSDEALLNALLADMVRNAEAMRTRYFEAVTDLQIGHKETFKKVTEDVTRRAGMSATAVVWGTSNEVRDSAFAKAGLNKMWVAVLDDNTCSHCKALHGKVINPGETFDANAGTTSLKVYRGNLQGPPRHPWCRCMLVGTKLKKKQ